MVFHPFQVTIPHIAYAGLGGFVVLFGMFSLFLREKLYIGEACWAFTFGVVIGPYGADIFNPRAWAGGSEETVNKIVLEFTRVVLAIGVFAIGVELPKAYMARHWKSLFFLLVPVMAWGWFVSAGLIYALIPGLNFLSSLAIAACLTPTDPILAAAVVGGKWADKHVPSHLRHLLAAESGCNDGAAFPFLFIALYFIIDSTGSEAARDWFLLLWLYQVILGIAIGSLLGYAFRHLMIFCQRRDLIDRHSYVAQYVSLAMLTIGVCTLLGADDLLAAFACGTTFAWDGFFNRQTEEAVFSSVIDLLFNIAAFVFLGAWMPFNKFSDAALSLSVWRLIVVAILVLLLRRLPIIVLLHRWIPDVKNLREAVFSGHFGPIGVGAIFISTLATMTLEDANTAKSQSEQAQRLADVIQPVVAFMVLCSIIIHGLSIPSFSLGRRVHSVSRSVSRTWSRHASAPDWTNQARLVERGANIVINRDIQMEEGKLVPDENLASSRASAITAATSMEKSSVDDNGSESKMEYSGTDPRQEVPPDGTDKVMVWQEGAYNVTERRRGPGDDVEVEVTKEGEEIQCVDRSSSSSSLTENGKRAGEQALSQDDQKVEEAGTQFSPKTVVSLNSSQLQDKRPEEQVDGDWASDYSNEGVPSPLSRRMSAGSGTRKRPKSLKIKTASSKAAAPASIRKGKLRNSIRRSYSQPQVPADGVPDDVEEEDRGRFAGSTATTFSAFPEDPTASSHHKRPSSSRSAMGEGTVTTFPTFPEDPTTSSHHKRPSSSRSAMGEGSGSLSYYHKRPSSARSAAGEGSLSWHPKRPASARSAMGEGYARNHQIERVFALSRTRESSPSRSVRFMDEDVYASRPGSASRSLAVSQVDLSLKGDEEQESPRNRVTFNVSGALPGASQEGSPTSPSSSGNSASLSRAGSWIGSGGSGGNNVRS